DAPGGRHADGVDRSPKNRKELVLIRARHAAKTIAGERKLDVRDQRGGLIGERRVDKWIVPGEMPLDPGAHRGGEFPHLQIKASIFPRRHPQGGLIEAYFGAEIGRIEAGVESRLDEAVNMRP